MHIPFVIWMWGYHIMSVKERGEKISVKPSEEAQSSIVLYTCLYFGACTASLDKISLIITYLQS